MKAQIKVSTMIKADEILGRITKQDIEIPLSVGLKFIKIKNEISAYSEYAVKRIMTLFPNIIEKPSDLTSGEVIVYNSIMDFLVEVDNGGLNMSDIEKCGDLPLKMEDIECLQELVNGSI